ncbi:septum formation initiator [Actinoplanes sp. NPDC051346]|uniref:septum formation initiator n=1 Tax=Actinoplanes sp. NPDC051346 TaxID=3155048 RepID=UPI00341BE64D
MRRRTLLVLAAWLSAILAAIIVGVVAVELVGARIVSTPGDVRSQAELKRALAASRSKESRAPSSPATNPESRPARTTAPATPNPTVRREFTITGGVAEVECLGGLARLVSWSPSRGYRVDEVDRGPDDEVSVKFDGPDDDDSDLEVACFDGLPVVADEDD